MACHPSQRPGCHLDSSCKGAILSIFVDEKIERDVSNARGWKIAAAVK